MSYDASLVATSVLDHVRLLVGDISNDPAKELLTDDSINALIDKENATGISGTLGVPYFVAATILETNMWRFVYIGKGVLRQRTGRENETHFGFSRDTLEGIEKGIESFRRQGTELLAGEGNNGLSVVFF